MQNVCIARVPPPIASFSAHFCAAHVIPNLHMQDLWSLN